jgi:membrane fusion protein (multidrug efflux system)
VQLHFRMQNANKLLPGMNANVQIRIPNSQNVVIPKQAVVMRSGKAVVFTENKGFAQWNYVTLGAENNSEVEITEGLESNLPVIITNNFQLAHEAPVEIVN